MGQSAPQSVELAAAHDPANGSALPAANSGGEATPLQDTEHVETAEQPAEKSTSVEAPPSDRDEVVPSDVAAIDAATRTNDGATTDALASTGSMEQGQHDSVISEVPAAESEEAGQEHHQQQQQGGEPASEEKEAHWASEAAAMNGESAAGVTAQDAVASEGGAMWQAESSAPESSFGASERGMRVLETASAAEAPEHHPAVVMTSEQAQEAMRLLAGVPAPRVADMTRSRSRSPSRGEHRAPLPVRERSPPVGAFAAGAYGGGQDAGAPKTENRVYVGNLSWDVHDSDLHDFMSEAGHVVSAQVMYSQEGKSKGSGLVEFSTPDEARTAIRTLNDRNFLGRDIYVREDRLPGNERRRAPAQSFAGPSRSRRPVPQLANAVATSNSLFISGIPSSMGWPELKELMRAAGNVARADVHKSHGKHIGTGTVAFETIEEAQNAISMFNGYEVDGKYFEIREDRFPGGPPRDRRRGEQRDSYRSRDEGYGGGNGASYGGGGGYGDEYGYGNGRASGYAGSPHASYGGSPAPPQGGGYSRQPANNYGAPYGAPYGQQSYGAATSFPGFAGGYNAPATQGFGFNATPQPFSNPGYGNTFAPMNGFVAGESYVPQPQQAPYARQQQPPASAQLHVDNLPWATTHEDLVELFQTTGAVSHAEIIHSPDGRSTGAGTVTMANPRDAQASQSRFQGYLYGGRRLKISFR